MKHFFLCTLLLVSQMSFATQTETCPRKLSVTYQGARTYSAKQLHMVAKKSGFGMSDQIEKIWRDLSAAPLSTIQGLELNLSSTEKSRCVYLPDGVKGNGDNETRIFRRSGKEILRISFSFGGHSYWTYHTIAELSPSSISVSNRSSKILGYFDHGSPRIEMGVANELELFVR